MSHTYAHYPTAKKRRLDELLRLEEVSVPAYYIYIGHGYLYLGHVAGSALTVYATTFTSYFLVMT